MKKIEGLVWLGRDNRIMVNDNDFSIEGAPTLIVQVTQAAMSALIHLMPVQ